jgi:RNA polymerase sigma factor (sigma-70 family)
MSMPPPYELEAVLRADDWLRRIARRLVGESDVSDDLVQDAWVTALSSKRSDRPWLFGVLRNLGREQQRRARRERDARSLLDAPKGAPSTDDVVDELTLRKRVTDGLLGLDEPYRTTLYLRYVNDESLPAIARRCGIAPSTVHQRIQRGLELLRREIDESYGGERRAWALGLLSLTKPAGLVSTALGGVIVGTSVKVAASVVLVGSVVALWIVNDPESERDAAVVAAGAEAVQEPEADRSLVRAEGRELGRTEVAVASEKPLIMAAATEPEWVAGRVIEVGGSPVPAARVGFAEDRTASDAPVATTDALGRFELPRSDGVTGFPAIECLDPHWVTLLPGVERDDVLEVVVGRAARFAGSVVNEAGEPIEGAVVRFVLRQSLFRELGIVRPWGTDDSRPRTRTDSRGWFEVDRAAGGESIGVLVSANGYSTAAVDAPREGDSAMHVVLHVVEDERLIQGFVLDAMGAPVAEASVSAGDEIATSAEDGSFRIAWRLRGAGAFARDNDGVWRAESDTSLLVAAKAGHLPARIPVADLDLSSTVVLHLGGPPLAIEGRVVDESGESREGLILWVADTTHFGHHVRESGGGRAHVRVSLEELTRGEASGEGTLSDEDGKFRLDGLLDRDYELRAYDPSSALLGGPWTVAAGANSLQLVVETEPGTQRVAGRVTSGSGAPIAGVYIRPLRGTTSNDGAQPPWMSGVPVGTNTDDEGLFEFPKLATEGTLLELQHDRFFIRHVVLEDFVDVEAMEIVQPSLCELQVELEDAAFADQLEILDLHDEPLELLEHFGAFLGAGPTAGFEDGKTNILQVLETARTLVLTKDGVEVLRRPLSLDVTERVVVRL